MLKEWSKGDKPSGEELDRRLDEAREKLAARQIAVKEKKLPVLILLEGWGAAGKGSVLGKIIRNMDPRFFKVEAMKRPTEEEKRKPFLYRHFVKIPEAGKFVFFDGGWMDEVTREYVRGGMKEKQYHKRIQSVRNFERQLTDNGYLVMKFFFHISQKEQAERIDSLMSNKNTKWRIGEEEIWQNTHYDEYMRGYGRYLFDTDQSGAPWYLIDSQNRKWAELQVLETMISGIDVALLNSRLAAPILQNTFPLKPIPKLSEIALEDKKLTDEEYRKELKSCQKRLRDLHNELYRKRIPVIIAYEGWDAAGKGGNIKRIASALDPRGYEVHPIASPEPHEKARHYLWRFWNRLPKDGHIAIFDRTWYGRVMVERLEGFCSENDWQRAYNEMNEFEKELSDWGAVVIKFWVQIDKDTQLERFTLRQNTPEKQWKITDEDWRNREKWDMYEEAIDEMLQKTNTTYAPWYVLESNDKKYARIKALKTVIKEIEKKL
ncbi:MAG: polyphosphate:AMP phosphotransferase [Lachnospiraceae bacterium]|nr:polyphosphate:AMP phosphotransferase [Lachnospiraceae bacterium]